MLYLGISLFLGLISIVVPPLLVITVPTWIAFTVLKALSVLFSWMSRV